MGPLKILWCNTKIEADHWTAIAVHSDCKNKIKWLNIISHSDNKTVIKALGPRKLITLQAFPHFIMLLRTWAEHTRTHKDAWLSSITSELQAQKCGMCAAAEKKANKANSVISNLTAGWYGLLICPLESFISTTQCIHSAVYDPNHHNHTKSKTQSMGLSPHTAETSWP